MVTIGVLALQGAVSEHLNLLSSLPEIRSILVKKPQDLDNVNGIILPGGESTAMGKLLHDFGLTQPLREKITDGLPVWGTCAGMILLAKEISGEETSHLGVMDIKVRRNAYGSQLDSFYTEQLIPEVSPSPVPLVFIRAPYVEKSAPGVKILTEVDNKIVAVEEKNMLATAFHPELTADLSFHKYFVEKIKQSR